MKKIINQKAVAIIPARLQSSRLPNKPILDICGLPMIIHVYKRCKLAKNLSEVFVATDSNEIYDLVIRNGGKAIMTSKDHGTGTDRIAEACKKIDAEIIVNVQGDEALVNPHYIDLAVDKLVQNPEIKIGILVNPFKKRNSPSDIKVVLNRFKDVMYFSREDIPSNSRHADAKMLKAYHIVPFRKKFLIEYSKMERTELEKVEFNEYLRVLEHGFKIRGIEVDSDAISVDTKEDLELVRNQMIKDAFFKKYKPA